MKTSLECVPCFVRQSLNAARFVTDDTAIQEQVMREILRTTAELDFNQSPPLVAQRIHRRLRLLTDFADPYQRSKERFQRLALELLPELSATVRAAEDPLLTAVRLAIAGNIIDMGTDHDVSESGVRLAIAEAQREPFVGDVEPLRSAIGSASRILYLTDNAGEIVFDRLLIEQLTPSRVVVAVRGAPIINDATIEDARFAGLDQIVEVIENGSDAPGTLLDDCSAHFREHFRNADLVIAKGQGNFETLSDTPGNIFFLLKIKCAVVASHTGIALGAQALIRAEA